MAAGLFEVRVIKISSSLIASLFEFQNIKFLSNLATSFKASNLVSKFFISWREISWKRTWKRRSVNLWKRPSVKPHQIELAEAECSLNQTNQVVLGHERNNETSFQIVPVILSHGKLYPTFENGSQLTLMTDELSFWADWFLEFAWTNRACGS